MKVKTLIIHLIIILLLTVITQVGGILWLISIFISKYRTWKVRYVFPVIYILANLLIVPTTAKLFGREQLPVIGKELRPRNMAYPLLFRNYVHSDLKILLEDVSRSMETDGYTMTYLDANFPFFDGFPLLPHLSHNDGKKIDLSFMYLDKDGNKTNKKPSVSGYGIYVNSEDNTTTKRCKSIGQWQYDFPKHLSMGKWNDLNFDAVGTKQLLLSLLESDRIEKIFIEPHLKASLGLNHKNKIRFQGCHAVRHDDHIHLQIK